MGLNWGICVKIWFKQKNPTCINTHEGVINYDREQEFPNHFLVDQHPVLSTSVSFAGLLVWVAFPEYYLLIHCENATQFWKHNGFLWLHGYIFHIYEFLDSVSHMANIYSSLSEGQW